MTQKIERTRNTNSEATVTTVSLNSTTATTISAANAKRLFFEINNADNVKAFWLRLYPASTDNTKRGMLITNKGGGRSHWEMPIDNIYTGEISAIADSDSPIAYTTEY